MQQQQQNMTEVSPAAQVRLEPARLLHRGRDLLRPGGSRPTAAIIPMDNPYCSCKPWWSRSVPAAAVPVESPCCSCKLTRSTAPPQFFGTGMEGGSGDHKAPPVYVVALRGLRPIRAIRWTIP